MAPDTDKQTRPKATSQHILFEELLCLYFKHDNVNTHSHVVMFAVNCRPRGVAGGEDPTDRRRAEPLYVPSPREHPAANRVRLLPFTYFILFFTFVSLCCDSVLYCQIITGCHGLLALKVAVGLILASIVQFGWDVFSQGW